MLLSDTASAVRTCDVCSASIPKAPMGRPPERCSDACRRAADARRKRRERDRLLTELRELRALRDRVREIAAA